MPGGSSGGTTTTQTTQNINSGPWSTQAPYLDRLFGSAQSIYNANPTLDYYPDSTVSPFTPAQTQGYNQVISTAQQGSPFLPASNQNLTDTLSGKYLDPSTNPYLTGTFNTAADAVKRQFQTATAPTTDSFFSGNGAYNSSARFNAQNNNNLGLGTTLDNLATSIYGGNYQNERQNQIAAQGMVPSLTQNQYTDPTAMINAGGAQQQQQQQQLTDQVNRFNFNQMSPWQTLGLFQGAISGNYGQNGTVQSTQQQPYYSNPLGTAVGGITSLAGTAGNLGWKPFG